MLREGQFLDPTRRAAVRGRLLDQEAGGGHRCSRHPGERRGGRHEVIAEPVIVTAQHGEELGLDRAEEGVQHGAGPPQTLRGSRLEIRQTIEVPGFHANRSQARPVLLDQAGHVLGQPPVADADEVDRDALLAQHVLQNRAELLPAGLRIEQDHGDIRRFTGLREQGVALAPLAMRRDERFETALEAEHLGQPLLADLSAPLPLFGIAPDADDEIPNQISQFSRVETIVVDDVDAIREVFVDDRMLVGDHHRAGGKTLEQAIAHDAGLLVGLRRQREADAGLVEALDDASPIERNRPPVGLEPLPGTSALEHVRAVDRDQVLFVEGLEKVVMPALGAAEPLPVDADVEQLGRFGDGGGKIRFGRGVEQLRQVRDGLPRPRKRFRAWLSARSESHDRASLWLTSFMTDFS